MTNDDSVPSSGLIDGRYQVLECVGQGGMAKVYRAEDTLLGRVVAIKLLRDGVEGDDSTAGRARSETTALASLNHPALVTLYDAQLASGRPQYLVMEFVDGPTLADRIAQGPLDPSDVAALTADLADALHGVHSAGIVHRDIKPSNVLLSLTPFPGSRSGAKLADFGISALVDAARLTSPGVVIGTAAYIAPEQLQGAMPAPPADIYSLGLVMLEALTGQRAFPQSEGIGAAMARLTAAPEVPAHVGPAWSDLLTAMTSTDPAGRPSASEVFATASGLSGTAAPPPRPTIPAAAAAAAFAAGAASSASAAPSGSASPLAAAAPSDPHEAATAAMTEAVGDLSAKPRDDGGDGPAVTRVLPAPSSATPSSADPRVARRGRGDAPRSRRRRGGVIGAVAAAAIAATVIAGAWMTGNASPDPASTNPPDTEPSVPAEPAAPAVSPGSDDSDDREGDDDTAENDRKAQQEAEKAAEEQRKAAEKAAEVQRKAAEKAAEEQRKAAEKAAEEAEEQPSAPEPTPEPGTEAPEGGAEPSPQPTASSAG